MLRAALVAAGRSPRLRRLAEAAPPVRAVVDRFVAGETLADGLAATRWLARTGRHASLDHLGESVTDATAARQAAKAYHEALAAIAAEDLPAGISVKPTHMGLAHEPDLAAELLDDLAATSGRVGAHLTLDMEGSDVTEATIGLVERLRGAGHHHVGCAVQSMLRRTISDVERLMSAPGGPASVRLCKGAYAEPAGIAHPNRADVDAAYRAAAARLLATPGSFPRFATHDAALLAYCRTEAARAGRARGDYELQMLYGVREPLQRELVRDGERVCVYVPYGTEWYPYFMRRLGERPANLVFFGRALLGRR